MKGICPVLLLLLLLGAAFQTVALILPFDESVSGVVSADQFGLAARAFERRGFLETRFAPPLFASPMRDGVYVPYTHHPPVAYTVAGISFQALGRSSFALRVPFLAASLAALLWLARRRPSDPRSVPPAAVAALGLSVPVFLTDATLVDSMPLSIALALAAYGSYEKARASEDGGGLRWYAVAAFLAAATSWYSYALLPPLLLDAWRRRRRGERTAPGVLALALPFGLAFLAVLVWIGWARGGLQPLLAELRFLSSTLVGGDFDVTHPQGFDTFYPSAMAQAFVLGLGPFGVLAAAGTWITRKDRSLGAVRLRSLLLFGLVPQLVFWSRAARHPFFMLLLWPWAVLGTAAALEAIARRIGDARRARLVLFVVALIGLALGGTSLLSRERWNVPRIAAALDQEFGEDDLLLAPVSEYRGGLRFATRATLLPVLSTSGWFEKVGGPELLPDLRRGLAPAVVAEETSLEGLEWLRPFVDPSAPPRWIGVAGPGPPGRLLALRLDPKALAAWIERPHPMGGR